MVNGQRINNELQLGDNQQSTDAQLIEQRDFNLQKE